MAYNRRSFLKSAGTAAATGREVAALSGLVGAVSCLCGGDSEFPGELESELGLGLRLALVQVNQQALVGGNCAVTHRFFASNVQGISSFAVG